MRTKMHRCESLDHIIELLESGKASKELRCINTKTAHNKASDISSYFKRHPEVGSKMAVRRKGHVVTIYVVDRMSHEEYSNLRKVPKALN